MLSRQYAEIKKQYTAARNLTPDTHLASTEATKAARNAQRIALQKGQDAAAAYKSMYQSAYDDNMRKQQAEIQEKQNTAAAAYKNYIQQNAQAITDDDIDDYIKTTVDTTKANAENQSKQQNAQTSKQESSVAGAVKKKLENITINDAKGAIQDAVRHANETVTDISRGNAKEALHDFNGTLKGNALDYQADKANQAAQNYTKSAAMHGEVGQKHIQQYNTDYRSEADKDAGATDAMRNMRKMQGNAAAGKGGVALRDYTNGDYEGRLNMNLAQLDKAEDAFTRQVNDEQAADAVAHDSSQLRVASRDYNNDVNTSERLSMGDYEGGDSNNTDTGSGDTDNSDEDSPEEDAVEEPSENPLDGYQTDWQSVLNVLTYYNDPTSKNWNTQKNPNAYDDKQKAEALRFVQDNNYTPLPASQETTALWNANPNNNPQVADKLRVLVEQSNPEFSKAWRTNATTRWQNGKMNTANNGNVFMQDTVDTKSDARCKNILLNLALNPKVANTDSSSQTTYDLTGFWNSMAGHVTPKFQMPKEGIIKLAQKLRNLIDYQLEDHIANNSLTDEDYSNFANIYGSKFTVDDKDYDYNDRQSSQWDKSVLDGYAEHIRNYLYTYKPEAQELNPNDKSLDSSVEHIGPMAQDIEQVNPACIHKNEDGIESVDTARLAMMNAGAIGDLARELKELKQVLGGL